MLPTSTIAVMFEGVVKLQDEAARACQHANTPLA